MGAGIFTTLLTNHRLIIIGVCVSFARVERMGLVVFRGYTQHPYVHTVSFFPLSPVCNQQGTRERKASPITFEPGRLLPSAWGLETARDRKRTSASGKQEHRLQEHSQEMSLGLWVRCSFHSMQWASSAGKQRPMGKVPKQQKRP